jgi:hypothetical protein
MEGPKFLSPKIVDPFCNPKPERCRLRNIRHGTDYGSLLPKKQERDTFILACQK